MPQNSYTINNEPGLNFRQHVNEALKALVGNNSGPSAPVVTFPYMFWVDTSGANPILKFRNAADTAWIVFGDMSLINLGLKGLTAGSAPVSPTPFQFWVDTSGTNPILNMRNQANDNWVIIGRCDIPNFGLLPLIGGTLSGPLIFSNNDYMSIPAGTTAQRPASPSIGAIRYNTTLTKYEGFNGTNWASLGGGGGSSLQWTDGPIAPISNIDSTNNRVYQFSQGGGQTLQAVIKVPSSYGPGQQLTLIVPYYSPDSSGSTLLQCTSTLIKNGVDPIISTTNQQTSSNTAITLTSANLVQLATMNLTSTIGKINNVAVSANDTILVNLQRGTDTGSSDLKVLTQSSELLIG